MVDLKVVAPQHLWYVVGFIAADGNLSSDGRHINITSKDVPHLRKIKRALLLSSKIGFKARGGSMEKIYGVLQFSDVRFYRYLLNIGLQPRKSLILDSLQIPNQYFRDFLRGLIDGDGTVRTWDHSSNGNEQWELRIFSAAPKFIGWLHRKIEDHFGVKGALIPQTESARRNTMYNLKFGKMAARKILAACYYEKALALARKQRLAKQCVESYVGWTRSLTVN